MKVQHLADTRLAATILRELGRESYHAVWRRMREFTAGRTSSDDDEIWLVEHDPVYTQGLSCSLEPFQSNTIPVVATDRGGQITYHGPGQMVVYTLMDLRRARRGIKWLVTLLEQAVIDLLVEHDIEGHRTDGAPGVYVDGAKVAALGLRVRRGASYHGLAVNVDMDLAPFERIDPCGYPGLQVTQLKALGIDLSPAQVGRRIATIIDSAFADNLPTTASALRSLPGK